METNLLLILFLLSAVPRAAAQAPASPQPKATDGELRVTAIAPGLDHPWSLEFLPDGRMLVSERPGRLRLVDRHGRVSESGLPMDRAAISRGPVNKGLSTIGMA